jgi:NarL family two-component system response regulator LiaR
MIMSDKKLRIMIVDDHRAVHQALAEMIGFVEDFELVAQASNGQEAVDLCREYEPDMVMMDVVMPIMDGVEATRQILKHNPNIKILALSSFQDNDSVNAMLRSGASGYVLKNASVDEMENIIRIVYNGNSVIDSQLMQQIMQSTAHESDNDFNLSSRELEILKLIAGGMSYGQVADQLTISMSTVKFHVGNILTKLDVETRNEAILLAAKNNII